MNRFWKLLNWELSRFGKLYAVLLLVILVLQFTGVLLYSFGIMSKFNAQMDGNFLSLSQYLQKNGVTNLEQYTSYTSYSLWFAAPIALGAVTLILYVLLIWYKEWFGKNTFVYRLLMLPTSRMNIYLAKLSAIVLFVLGLVAFQLIILYLQMLTFNAIINQELRQYISMAELISRNRMLSVFYPWHFIQFLFYYGLGITAVIVVFTLIMLERSFRIKGIVAAVGYGATMIFLILAPVVFRDHWGRDYFYPNEIFFTVVVVMVLISSGSLWFSSFLLNKKISV
ncbi:hypothetical protein EHS13_30765 [Paenibacillus psychroresistens]|uniref:Uncharacterized protein n=1 Tax=Paenibacillus psychroresistens TaxID=1778678 RepID=A0A6B8RRD7_9BACL|nr:hypothetical protein [Paenibacillus psychroresistens]QGQ98950.1 hypothetical protein EHS13_30765 [Paenibacillus psychroresistens]